MTIFRGIDGILYKLFLVSPAKFTGSWMEKENLFTKERSKVKNCEKFESVSYR